MEPSRYNFFDPSEPVAHLTGNLPHWRQEGTTYFVTFRLADSIPQAKLHQWLEEKEAWLKQHPEPHTDAEKADFWERFPARFHRWLDANYGACVLKTCEVKTCMEEILRYFDGARYYLGEFVVMPNHVHAVTTPNAGYALSDILHSWKSYSANKINAMLGRRGTLWQGESFDHIVRSAAHLERINGYIRENPRPRKDGGAKDATR
jgi:REP element-mobilizing transposase RayT